MSADDQTQARFDAIAEAGSPAFTRHAGATLERLSSLAKAGELEEMSRTLIAHVAVHPSDRGGLVKSVPAKILNQYIYIHRQRSLRAVERWLDQTPDWTDALVRAVNNPERFAAIAEGMADAVGSAEIT